MPISNKTKLLFIGLILIVIGFLVFLTMQSVQFRITSITPDNNKYPDLMGVMEVHFNKKLDKDALQGRLDSGGAVNLLTTSFESKNHITVHDDYLTIIFGTTPREGEYTLEFIDITAESGDSLSETVPLIVKHIEYDDLSSRDREMLDTFIVENESEISFAENPFLTKLPRETDGYLISYEFIDESQEIPTVTITTKAFPPGSNAAPATSQETAEYEAEIRKYRTEALDWIKANGGNLEDFYIRYTEPELASEFPTGRLPATQ